MGPVASQAQLDDVRTGMQKLQSECDTVVGGPEALDGPGYFVHPTLLQARNNDTSFLHELEVFGPCATILPYDGKVATAVDLMNRGGGCLVASAYSDDKKFVEELVTGIAPWHGRVWVGSEKTMGHALSPGAVAAVSVDLHGLRSEWLRPCFFEGHGAGLLVGLAAPIPLISEAVARQAACDDEDLEAPVLDVAIPRRLRPRFGSVSYARLKSGRIQVEGHRVTAAPAHSPRLAEAIAAELIAWLQDGRFPLHLPVRPLSGRGGLIPLDN